MPTVRRGVGANDMTMGDSVLGAVVVSVALVPFGVWKIADLVICALKHLGVWT